MTVDDQRMWASPADSPCADARYMARFGLQVDPWDLDQCVECELCAGCAVHLCQRDEASIVLHADWFMAFASPGEVECGSVGGPPNLVPSQYAPRPCQLPDRHKGTHRARMGWAWPARKTINQEAS